MTTKETRQVDSMGYVIRHDDNYPADMLGAFRANPNNLMLLHDDWIGQGFGWSADGMIITIAGYTYDNVLQIQVELPPTLNANDELTFEQFKYELSDPNDFAEYFDGYDNIIYLQADLTKIAYWKLVSATGGTVYKAYRNVDGQRGGFPHSETGATTSTNVEWEVGTTIGLAGLSTSASSDYTQPSGAVGAFISTDGPTTLNASTTRTVDFSIPFGQLFTFGFKWAANTTFSNSSTFAIARKVNGTVSALSEVSLVYTTGATSTVVIAPFGEIGPGTYTISVANGTVAMNSLEVLSQRIG